MRQGDPGEAGYRVVLTKPFYMAVMELTNRQLRQFFPRHDSGVAWGLSRNGPSQPACLRISRANEFARLLSARDPKWDYRLPTEPEWEYACRAGSSTRFFWGDSVDQAHLYANLLDSQTKALHPAEFRSVPAIPGDDGARGPAPVGSYKPNPWGLYDIHGNVSEWVTDRFAPYPRGVRRDPPPVGGGGRQLLRGGVYSASPDHARASRRMVGRHPTGLRLIAIPKAKTDK